MTGSVFDSISTGDIGILDGGLNIGNQGVSNKDLKVIFGSLAQSQTAQISQRVEERKRRDQLLIVSSSVVVLILLLILVFFYQKHPKSWV